LANQVDEEADGVPVPDIVLALKRGGVVDALYLTLEKGLEGLPGAPEIKVILIQPLRSEVLAKSRGGVVGFQRVSPDCWLTLPHKLRGEARERQPLRHPSAEPRQLHAVVRPQGGGISRSRQILRARKSLISRWRGTVDVFPAARFT
jgi:hypothetical protein